MTLFVGGNSLIVGAPGLAKTLLIHTMARVLDLKFSRIQFTPDLMPSDITGTDLVQEDADHRPPPDGVRARADLRQHRAGRRNQPHAAEDAVGAARGDAGASRHDPGHAPTSWTSRSSCSPRRTRSSWKAPIRCPKRSSTASCSTSSSTTRRTTRSYDVVRTTTALQDPTARAAGQRRGSDRRSSGWCARCRWPSR